MSKQKFLIWVCAVIFLLGIAGSTWLLLAPHGTQVNIAQDGTVLHAFDLDTARDQTLEIEYEGRINTVQIEMEKSVCWRQNARIRLAFTWAG